MITAARLLYVQKLEDSEITHNRGMACEDDRTSRDGKTNLSVTRNHLWTFCWKKRSVIYGVIIRNCSLFKEGNYDVT